MNLSNCQYYVKFGVLVDVLYLRKEKFEVIVLYFPEIFYTRTLSFVYVRLFVCMCLSVCLSVRLHSWTYKSCLLLPY